MASADDTSMPLVLAHRAQPIVARAAIMPFEQANTRDKASNNTTNNNTTNNNTTNNNAIMSTVQAPPGTNPQNTVQANRDSDADQGAQDNDESSNENKSDDDDMSRYSFRESDYDSDGNSVDEFDKAQERENRLMQFNEDGVLHWLQNESSYTASEPGRQPQSSERRLYDAASVFELRQYVRERGLCDPYPEGLTLKYFYIRVLEQGDRNKKFRFLDLPPEMRNIVYSELLTFGYCCCRMCVECGSDHQCICLARRCDIAILQVSKQVCKEAKDILYADNTVESKIFFLSGPVRSAKIHNTEFGDALMARREGFYAGMHCLPDWFRRIQHLQLTIGAHGHGEMARGFEFLQGCLLNIASFLLEGHSLKTLRIHVTNHLYDPLTEAEDAEHFMNILLYPLRRLSGFKNVVFTGDVEDALSLNIKTQMQGPKTQTFNTVKHLHHLRKEAHAFVSMMEELNPSDFRDSIYELHEVWQGPSLVNRVKWLLEETAYFSYFEEDGEGQFRDACAEENLHMKMWDLESCLNGADFRRFEQKKVEYETARASRMPLDPKEISFGKGGRVEEYLCEYYDRPWTSRIVDDRFD